MKIRCVSIVILCIVSGALYADGDSASMSADRKDDRDRSTTQEDGLRRVRPEDPVKSKARYESNATIHNLMKVSSLIAQSQRPNGLTDKMRVQGRACP